MDKLQWFKFTPSDWMMGKIMKCPEVTQARFMRLCCLYWNKQCQLSYEDAEIEIDEEHIKILIKKKILKVVGDSISIHFLDEQMNEINASNYAKSNSGKMGNLKRWKPDLYNKVISGKLSLPDALAIANQSQTDEKTSHPDDNLSQPDRTPIAPRSQNIADKRREDKDKIREDKDDDGEYKPPSPDSILSVQECLRHYQKNKRVIQAVCDNDKNKITRQEIDERLTKFVSHLVENGEEVKQYKDFCSHFLRWHKKNRMGSINGRRAEKPIF